METIALPIRVMVDRRQGATGSRQVPAPQLAMYSCTSPETGSSTISVRNDFGKGRSPVTSRAPYALAPGSVIS